MTDRATGDESCRPAPGIAPSGGTRRARSATPAAAAQEAEGRVHCQESSVTFARIRMVKIVIESSTK
jgi:hypothetical protein